jgi:hypothetical protein
MPDLILKSYRNLIFSVDGYVKRIIIDDSQWLTSSSFGCRDASLGISQHVIDDLDFVLSERM